MENVDELFLLCNNSYKNLVENFNPGIRQLVNSFKVYEKALSNLANATLGVADSAINVGQSAQLNRSPSSELGNALLQTADYFKDEYAELEDQAKCLHQDLILPLETKAGTEYKAFSVAYKKFLHGHKTMVSPCDKANQSLMKIRKKSKASPMMDPKEVQHLRRLKECQFQLEQYLLTNTKQILLFEREQYCYVLERLCNLFDVLSAQHSKLDSVLKKRVVEWREVYNRPLSLPDSADTLLRKSTNEHQIGATDSASDSLLKQSDYSLPPAPSSNPQVRVILPAAASDATQLDLVKDDVISLLGDRHDGWHYGRSRMNDKYGWFALSFTEPIRSAADPETNTGTKQDNNLSRSLGNLSSNQVTPQPSYQDMRHQASPLPFARNDLVARRSKRSSSLYEDLAIVADQRLDHLSPSQMDGGYASYALPVPQMKQQQMLSPAFEQRQQHQHQSMMDSDYSSGMSYGGGVGNEPPPALAHIPPPPPLHVSFDESIKRNDRQQDDSRVIYRQPNWHVTNGGDANDGVRQVGGGGGSNSYRTPSPSSSSSYSTGHGIAQDRYHHHHQHRHQTQPRIEDEDRFDDREGGGGGGISQVKLRKVRTNDRSAPKFN